MPRSPWAPADESVGLDLPVVRMAHGLVHAAHARFSCEYVSTSVVSLHRASRGIDGAILDDGRTLPADVVMNSAGPWAAEVARRAGVGLAIKRQPGMLVT